MVFSNHEYKLRKLSDLRAYSMNAIIGQVDPADLSGIDEWFWRHLWDEVVL